MPLFTKNDGIKARMSTSSRKILPGLWLVGTPIGNLSDLTLRAQEVLKVCDEVYCEDTRRTRILLNHLGLQKPLHRLDEAVLTKKLPEIADKIREGKVLAMVSDAGMPGINDPGARAVASLNEEGLAIHLAPGVSAVTSLVALSGCVGAEGFSFRGYFPRQKSLQEKQWGLCEASDQALLWMESPLRMKATLQSLLKRLPQATLVVAKEMTKVFEKIWRGASMDIVPEVLQELHREGTKGEWMFLVQGACKLPPVVEGSDDLLKALKCLKDCGVSNAEAARSLSQTFGLSRKVIYQQILKIYSQKN